ncbi:MAG: InlB B-repeat-containing protein [Bacillota bacterium]|nr:InlB B-repeat-containing protein [Bacillota bacterium]
MATVYSAWSGGWKPKGSSVYKKYRAKLEYSAVAETAKTITYRCTLYVNINSSVSGNYSGTLNAAGQTANGSCSTTYGDDKTVVCVKAVTKEFAKGNAARTETITGGVRSSTGSWTGATVTATAAVTVPAQSYTITFSSDYGNPPPVQIKVHDAEAVLTETVPARSGYDFAGWNTQADGDGTAYPKGGTIPASVNQDIVLYAQWHISYRPPQIDDLRAYRVAADITTPDPPVLSSGERCYCDFIYAPAVAAQSQDIRVQFGDSAPVGAEVSGTLHYGYSAAGQLPTTQEGVITVIITVTDYRGNIYTYEAATYVSIENYIFDAFKGAESGEEYQSFAVGGIARDFNDPKRSEKGNFDVYMDMSLVLDDCKITDSGTTLTVTSGAGTTDGKLAQAVIDAFGYAAAKDILEV